MMRYFLYLPMSTKEILREIDSLPVNEKLLIIEKTLNSIEKENNNVLEKAAMALTGDYKTDKELTAFTALDWENFYEAR
jgi:hypothetical protein